VFKQRLIFVTYAFALVALAIMKDARSSSPEEPPPDVVSSVLSFYGSQLTSHASFMVGLFVALFALIQVHELLVEWVFQFAAVSIVSALVYSMFRIVLYGSLSGVVLHARMVDWEQVISKVKEERFKHGMVDIFASAQLKRTTLFRGKLYDLYTGYSKSANRYVSFWIQPPSVISVIVGILIVGVMFGWSGYALVIAYGLWELVVLLVNRLSLRFVRRLPSPLPLSL
jgi:hypothetical protein